MKRAIIDKLIVAAEHSAKSCHHPACKATGEYAANPEQYCTCHVQKARIAMAALKNAGPWREVQH